MSKRWTADDIKGLGLKTDLGKTVTKSVENIPKNIPQTGEKRFQALGRMKSREMNDTEKKYAAHLELLKQGGVILKWWFECMNLRLGDNCFYMIDFLVLQSTGHLEVHEVKGYWTDDALVKIKVAAETFPFRFVAIQRKKGEWITREF